MTEEAFDFICVLRGASKRKGLGPALRAHLERHPRWHPDGYWTPGFVDAVGRVRKNYGFNLLIAEGDDWTKVRAKMLRRLRLVEPLIRACRKAGGSLTLDVAAMPGPHWFTRSVRLPPDDLRFLSRLGVGWEVTAYAVSEPPSRTARSQAKRPARRTPVKP